jgi:2,3-bisphosphoglycerate-dependent phosphoglycerate mutase
MALLRSGKKSLPLMQHSVELLALHKMPNVIITPHNAYNSIEAVLRINNTTTENVIKFWYGDVKNKVKAPQKSTGKLLLVRHAESEWNASGKWSGITDVHLSEKGFREAGMFGVALADLGIDIDRAFCSEQIRTLETLEGMLNTAQQFDVPLERTSAINERDYGEYTGKNKWEMRDLLGEEQFNAVRRGWDVSIPGGETLKMVYERVVPFYVDRVLPLINEGKNVLIVAHGNSIRALIKYIEKLSENQVTDLEMMFGTIIMYDLNEDGTALKRTDSNIDTTPPNA